MEHRGKRNKEKARSRLKKRMIGISRSLHDREHSGEYRQSGKHRYKRVESANCYRIFRNIGIFRKIASVSKSYTHTETQRKESLSHCRVDNAEHAAFDIIEIRNEEELDALYSSRHRERDYSREYEHNEQRGHKNFTYLFDTFLNAECKNKHT